MVSEIALIITAIGVVGVVLGLRQSYRERLRQFESRYVERYWKILDLLSLDALRGFCPEAIIDSDSKAIRSYILLCEDEMEMRMNGYVADRTYELWADGIRSQFRQPMFGRIWEQVKDEAGKNNTFQYVHLRHLLDDKDACAYDPLTIAVWRRRVRGLAGLSGV